MSFKRYVRRLVTRYSPEVPSVLVEESMRRQLTVEQRHSILESSWRDVPAEDDFMRLRPSRVMSVRYVTSGQRHGLAASLDWDRIPAVVEFPSRDAGTRLEKELLR